MTVELKSKTIGGIRFELSELPAYQANEAFHRFISLAGSFLPVIVAAYKSKGTEVGTDGLLMVALERLPVVLAAAKPADVTALTRELLEPCYVIGKERLRFNDVADELLRGKMLVFQEVRYWALEVHFGGFFAELAAKFGKRPAAPAPSSSISPTT